MVDFTNTKVIGSTKLKGTLIHELKYRFYPRNPSGRDHRGRNHDNFVPLGDKFLPLSPCQVIKSEIETACML